MTASDDFYARAVASSPAPSMEGGASGYFSAPQEALDPNLFENGMLRPEVRTFVTSTLFAELKTLGLRAPSSWTYIWLAGSGISYQWAADRGNGDLDVLFGVDFPALVRSNEDWGGYTEEQLASWLNHALKTDLWPRTAHHQIGDQSYEVTFYLNPGTGRDIQAINPYAAYDVRKNSWTVTPVETSSVSPARMYPQAWFEASDRDKGLAGELVNRYSIARQELAYAAPGTPQWHNKGSELRLIGEQAQALFDQIHGGRHAAFTPEGHGYGDWHNFRWQRAKEQGVVHGLKGILDARQAATSASDTELYGGPIASADDALLHAQMVHQNRAGLR
jgi:hypothetical protein